MSSQLEPDIERDKNLPSLAITEPGKPPSSSCSALYDVEEGENLSMGFGSQVYREAYSTNLSGLPRH
jgi:hypothetical protein